MSGLNNMLPQTAQGWDQAAYMSVVIGGIILFFAFISGALSGGSLMTKIFKFSVIVIMVVLFVFFKSRANKLRGLN